MPLSGSRFEAPTDSPLHSNQNRELPADRPDDTFTDLSAAFEDAEPDEDLELPDPDESPSEQQTRGKVVIQLGDMDLPSWEHDLKADLEVIEALLAEMGKVSPADDAKLQHLKEYILQKIEVAHQSQQPKGVAVYRLR